MLKRLACAITYREIASCLAMTVGGEGSKSALIKHFHHYFIYYNNTSTKKQICVSNAFYVFFAKKHPFKWLKIYS
jgi:hypothetical protein